jgi:hypothetical protein
MGVHWVDSTSSELKGQAFTVGWDAGAKEYRIALIGLATLE